MTPPHLLTPDASALLAQWQTLLKNPRLAQAVESEAKSRVVEFLEGLARYQTISGTRRAEELPCVFTCGNARLLDCGGDADAPQVMLVPSLINRYYILDLTQKLSLARYLRGRGLRVFIVDWGSPGAAEKHFNCSMYVSEHLTLMAEWIKQSAPMHLTVAGYCMGGLLALALACARPDLVDALACFATPWDFSVPDFPKVVLSDSDVDSVDRYIDAADMLSAETIHTLFHLANPFAFQTKLREFSRMKQGSPAMQEFLAIEQWVQDGVPMTRAVAKDCLVEWAQHNITARLKWRACGNVVDPSMLCMPVFIAAPKGDKIVPASCALPLADLCKHVTTVEPTCGHVGMIVGRHSKAALWEPFTEWVHHQAA